MRHTHLATTHYRLQPKLYLPPPYTSPRKSAYYLHRHTYLHPKQAGKPLKSLGTIPWRVSKVHLMPAWAHSPPPSVRASAISYNFQSCQISPRQKPPTLLYTLAGCPPSLSTEVQGSAFYLYLPFPLLHLERKQKGFPTMVCLLLPPPPPSLQLYHQVNSKHQTRYSNGTRQLTLLSSINSSVSPCLWPHPSFSSTTPSGPSSW